MRRVGRIRHVGRTGLAAALAVSSIVVVGARPGGAVAESSSSHALTAVMGPKTWVAWRVSTVVTGPLLIRMTGASQTQVEDAWVLDANHQYCCGGGGDSGNPGLQLGAYGIALDEAVGTNGAAAGQSNNSIPPGQYTLGAAVGGSTVAAGLVAVYVTAPPGTQILGFHSGPARELTDADFPGVTVNAGCVTHEAVNGTVAVNVRHSLFGFFVSINRSAVISYTAPSGYTSPDYSYGQGPGWDDASSGIYYLHLHENETSVNTLWGCETIALIEDVDLP